MDELERACRRQVFVDWEQFGAPARLFVNTVPATVRDVSFLGRGVLDYLGPRLSPSMVTLEITEGQVIENLNLYREAMHAFLDLGFTFAIDDVGAGYSGLEKIAHLNPRYLKLDRELIKDIDSSYIRREMARALKAFADRIGSTIIAEGIEREGELRALVDLGIDYGQGFLLGRPLAAARPLAPVGSIRAAQPATS